MKGRKKGSTFLAALFGTALLLGAGTTAHALSTTIGGASCLSCFGSTYTLTVNEVGPSGVGTLYNVAYSVNTSGYTGAGLGLDAIAYKIATEANILNTSVTVQPDTFSAPVWGSLSAGGCNATATAGFICSASSNLGGVAAPVDGTYTFQHGVTLANGSLFGDPSQWSIKALYVNAEGGARGLTSENGVVPVPGTLLMFGLGFALFIGWSLRPGRLMSLRPSSPETVNLNLASLA